MVSSNISLLLMAVSMKTDSILLPSLSLLLSPFFNSTAEQSICLFWIIWEVFYIERLSIYSIVKHPKWCLSVRCRNMWCLSINYWAGMLMTRDILWKRLAILVFFDLNQRSKCQHPLDHRKSKRIPEKHLLLFPWLHFSLWLCGSQQMWKILQSGQ